MSLIKPTAPKSTVSKAPSADSLLQQFVGYRMKRAYLLVQDDLESTLAPFGLRTGTFSALAVVVASPGISQSDLGAKLKIKRSGVVVVIDELERAGALKRKPVKGDRRTNALTVTAQGRRLWEQVEKAVQFHEASLFSDLSPDEVIHLHELLGRISKSPNSE